MAAVERRHHRLIEPLRHGDHTRLAASQRQVGVLVDEVGHPHDVGVGERLEDEMTIGDRSEEARLGLRPDPTADQVGSLTRVPDPACGVVLRKPAPLSGIRRPPKPLGTAPGCQMPLAN